MTLLLSSTPISFIHSSTTQDTSLAIKCAILAKIFETNFSDSVCVCAFIFFHREGFFRLQDLQDMLERYGSTILCCEYLSGCFCQVPSSLFPNLSYFTSKDVTPARRKLERKLYDILCSYLFIYYLLLFIKTLFTFGTENSFR